MTYVLTENGKAVYTGAVNYYAIGNRNRGFFSYAVKATRAGYLDSAVRGPLSTTVSLICGNIATLTAPANSLSGNYSVSWSASATAGVSYVLTENEMRRRMIARSRPSSPSARTVAFTITFKARQSGRSSLSDGRRTLPANTTSAGSNSRSSRSPLAAAPSRHQACGTPTSTAGSAWPSSASTGA